MTTVALTRGKSLSLEIDTLATVQGFLLIRTFVSNFFLGGLFIRVAGLLFWDCVYDCQL